MQNQVRILWWIVGGLLAWGVIHALGAYLGGADGAHDLRKALVVGVSFAVFLGFWGAMMLVRRGRLARQSRGSEQSDGGPPD